MVHVNGGGSASTTLCGDSEDPPRTIILYLSNAVQCIPPVFHLLKPEFNNDCTCNCTLIALGGCGCNGGRRFLKIFVCHTPELVRFLIFSGRC